jgi:hypothetical protein
MTTSLQFNVCHSYATVPVLYIAIFQLSGAPGFEPGQVSFSCNPQLEEDIASVIYTLETYLEKLHSSNQNLTKTTSKLITTDYMMTDEISPTSTQQDSSSCGPGSMHSKE